MNENLCGISATGAWFSRIPFMGSVLFDKNAFDKNALPPSLPGRPWNLDYVDPGDVRQVVAIDHESFDRPWCKDEFYGAFRGDTFGLMVYCLVARTRDRSVYGYCVYQLRNRYIRIWRLAVDRDHASIGVGSGLVEAVKCRLDSKLRKDLVVVVPEVALPAQLFFRAQGFVASAIVPGGYRMIFRQEWR